MSTKRWVELLLIVRYIIFEYLQSNSAWKVFGLQTKICEKAAAFFALFFDGRTRDLSKTNNGMEKRYVQNVAVANMLFWAA